MEMNKSIQETWHNIRHILQNYILNTSTPLIFKDLLEKLSQVCQTFSLKESEAKIDFMQKRLRNSQFTSFM